MRWFSTPSKRENPRDTLVRYSTAIDAQFDENSASEAQKAGYVMLLGALRNVASAQQSGRQLAINLAVGRAIGLCEAYIETHEIDVPAYVPSS